MSYMRNINNLGNLLRENADNRKVVDSKRLNIRDLDEQDFKKQFGV